MSHLVHAGDIEVDASTFTGNLSITDVDVQTALDTIDGLTPTPWLSSGGTIWEVDSTDEVVIGLPSPTVIIDQAKLHMVSNGSTDATNAFTVEESGRAQIFNVRDDGAIAIALDGATLVHGDFAGATGALTLTSPTSNLLYMRADTSNSVRFEDTASALKGSITLNNTTGNLDISANAQDTGVISFNAGATSSKPALHVGYDNNVFFGADTTVTDGSGEGVIAIKDAVVAPTTNPVNGALLYAAGGNLLSRDSAGNLVNLHDLTSSSYNATGAGSFSPGVLNTPDDVTGSSYTISTETNDLYMFYLWLRYYSTTVARWSLFPNLDGVDLSSSSYSRLFTTVSTGSGNYEETLVMAPVTGTGVSMTFKWRLSQGTGVLGTLAYSGARGLYRWKA